MPGRIYVAPPDPQATQQPVPASAPVVANDELAALEGKQAGERVEIVCPLCDGALTVSTLDDFELFRCHRQLLLTAPPLHENQ